MKLEVIMLSKISQTQKDKYCMLSLICRMKTYKDAHIMNIYVYDNNVKGGLIGGKVMGGMRAKEKLMER
jgi:hypothetical protein